MLYGFHTVREALRRRARKLLALFATEAAARRLEPEIAEADVALHIVRPELLDQRLGPTAVHQGVVLESRPLPALDVADIATSGGPLLALDGVTDPHNIGAILRTAAAFGVRGLILVDRGTPHLDGVLAKAASGALEHVPVVQVVNLARALDEVGSFGILRVGLDSDAAVNLATIRIDQPVLLVLGAEGAGLRRLTRGRCDIIARLDLPGAIHSLNVSVACGVALASLRSSARHGGLDEGVIDATRTLA